MTNLMSPGDLRETMQLLGYPDESVGRLMTPDYVAVRPEWTVERSLQHIRRLGKDSETINVIFVTDARWKLLDELVLRKLILADPSEKIESLMDFSFTQVDVEDDREVAAQLIQRYDLSVLPVVDKSGILLGIVTVDDILDVVEEETTEDFQLTAAVEPLKTPYREVSIFSLFRKRVVWLIALIFISLISSGIIAAYEDVLASALALAFFIPLLNAGGGNVGAQSATLVIRAQATGDVELDQWLGIAFKELKVGLLLGLCMGAITYFFGLYMGGTQVAIVVGLSMFSIVAVINVIGVSLPFFLAWVRLDPAMASNPLITSVADAVGLIIYFFLATVFLKTL
jgi:magnesium transporter